MKKTRTDLSSVYHLLEAYYTRGLVALKTPEQQQLAQQLMEEAGLNHQQIKNWLGNKRKKLAGIMPKPKPKIIQRQKSGRDIFFQKFMKDKKDLPGKDALALAAAEWGKIKDSPAGAEFHEAAKACPVTEPGHLVDEQVPQYMKHLCHKMTNLVGKMEKCGTEVLVLCYNAKDGSVHQVGSDKGLAFIQKRGDIFSNFLAFVAGENPVAKPKKQLRQEVIDLLDKRYCEATGIRKCSYEQMRKGFVVLEGLPDSIIFTDPWSCGKARLTEVLKLGDQLKFRRVTQNVEQPVCSEATSTDENQPPELPVCVTATTPELPVCDVAAASHLSETFTAATQLSDEFAEKNQADTPPRPKRRRIENKKKGNEREVENDEGKIIKEQQKKNVASKKKHDTKVVTFENVYAVESILGARMRRKRKEYLVKWQGFSAKHNSWVPASSVLDDNLLKLWKKQ